MLDVDMFDHQFFGISQGESVLTDPQQRMVLHQFFSTLNASAETLTMIRGCDRTAVVGICSTEYAAMLLKFGIATPCEWREGVIGRTIPSALPRAAGS